MHSFRIHFCWHSRAAQIADLSEFDVSRLVATERVLYKHSSLESSYYITVTLLLAQSIYLFLCISLHYQTHSRLYDTVF